LLDVFIKRFYYIYYAPFMSVLLDAMCKSVTRISFRSISF